MIKLHPLGCNNKTNLSKNKFFKRQVNLTDDFGKYAYKTLFFCAFLIGGDVKSSIDSLNK